MVAKAESLTSAAASASVMEVSTGASEANREDAAGGKGGAQLKQTASCLASLAACAVTAMGSGSPTTKASVQRLLDMGCTVGHSTLAYTRAFAGAEIHAIERKKTEAGNYQFKARSDGHDHYFWSAMLAIYGMGRKAPAINFAW